MNLLNSARLTFLGVALTLASPSISQTAPITADALLQYASMRYDRAHHERSGEVLGLLNNVEVVVHFFCSDVCPDYTVRIIHFNIEPGAKCAEVGGVEKSTRIPISIAAMQKAFCFPKVLTDNWDTYVR